MNQEAPRALFADPEVWNQCGFSTQVRKFPPRNNRTEFLGIPLADSAEVTVLTTGWWLMRVVNQNGGKRGILIRGPHPLDIRLSNYYHGPEEPSMNIIIKPITNAEILTINNPEQNGLISHTLTLSLLEAQTEFNRLILQLYANNDIPASLQMALITLYRMQQEYPEATLFQQELANVVGTTRETLARGYLKEYVVQGVLQRGRRLFVLTDRVPLLER